MPTGHTGVDDRTTLFAGERLYWTWLDHDVSTGDYTAFVSRIDDLVAGQALHIPVIGASFPRIVVAENGELVVVASEGWAPLTPETTVVSELRPYGPELASIAMTGLPCQGGGALIAASCQRDQTLGLTLVKVRAPGEFVIGESIEHGAGRLDSCAATGAPGIVTVSELLTCRREADGGYLALFREGGSLGPLRVASFRPDGTHRGTRPMLDLRSLREAHAVTMTTREAVWSFVLSREPYERPGDVSIDAARVIGTDVSVGGALAIDPLPSAGVPLIHGAIAMGSRIAVLYSNAYLTWTRFDPATRTFDAPQVIADVPCGVRGSAGRTSTGIYLPFDCAERSYLVRMCPSD